MEQNFRQDQMIDLVGDSTNSFTLFGYHIVNHHKLYGPLQSHPLMFIIWVGAIYTPIFSLTHLSRLSAVGSNELKKIDKNLRVCGR